MRHAMPSQNSAPRPVPSLHTVFSLLEREYVDSRLGNKQNPLDELVYIILSLQTNESRYQEIYRSFKLRFPRWSLLLDAPVDEIAQAISAGGLARQKALHLQKIA